MAAGVWNPGGAHGPSSGGGETVEDSMGPEAQAVVGPVGRMEHGPEAQAAGRTREDGAWGLRPRQWGGPWGGWSTGPEAQAVGARGPSSGVCGSGPAVSAPQRDVVGPFLWGSVSEVWGGGAVLDLEAPVGWPPVQPDAGTALFCLRALMSWDPVF